MEDQCKSCGLMHSVNQPCTAQHASPPKSPVFTKRRSLKSPCVTPSVTPSTSGRSTPCNVGLSGDLDSPDGPPPGKQKRLSGVFFDDLDLKEDLGEANVGSDHEGEEVIECDVGGASQYADAADVDPNADGLLLGYAYFPSEVTLPNLVPVRDGLVELELTPGKYQYGFNFFCRIPINSNLMTLIS